MPLWLAAALLVLSLSGIFLRFLLVFCAICCFLSYTILIFCWQQPAPLISD